MKTPKSTNLEWADISHELVRTYHFPDDSTVTIEGPVALSVSPDSGNHRVVYEVDGVLQSAYTKNEWRLLTWEVQRGTRPFIGFGPDIQERLGLSLDGMPTEANFIDSMFMTPETDGEGRCTLCGEEIV